MFPIVLVFILRESADRSDNPTSRRNMNSRNVQKTTFHTHHSHIDASSVLWLLVLSKTDTPVLSFPCNLNITSKEASNWPKILALK